MPLGWESNTESMAEYPGSQTHSLLLYMHQHASAHNNSRNAVNELYVQYEPGGTLKPTCLSSTLCLSSIRNSDRNFYACSYVRVCLSQVSQVCQHTFPTQHRCLHQQYLELSCNKFCPLIGQSSATNPLSNLQVHYIALYQIGLPDRTTGKACFTNCCIQRETVFNCPFLSHY